MFRTPGITEPDRIQVSLGRGVVLVGRKPVLLVQLVQPLENGLSMSLRLDRPAHRFVDGGRDAGRVRLLEELDEVFVEVHRDAALLHRNSIPNLPANAPSGVVRQPLAVSPWRRPSWG